MKLLLYCTKAKPMLRDYRGKAIYDRFVISPTDRPFTSDDKQPILNGKIVAECDFEVEEIDTMALSEHVYDDYYNDNIDRISKESCLTCEQMCEYLGTTWDSKGYAIHIKNLHIFDEPKELSEYHKIEEVGDMLFTELLTKSTKNMMRVSINHWDYFTYNTEDIRIMIPVSPEEMCRIANKEQDILVRKRVLKEILNND